MLQEFSYVAPSTQEEVIRLLKDHAGKLRILAGGTDLLVDIHNGAPAPQMLLDIKKVPQFNKITFSAKDGLSIGSTVTCRELIDNPVLARRFPLISEAASLIGSTQLRNRATIGGNICTASPCADLGCALLCLDAKLELISHEGIRIIDLRDFFTGVKKTKIKNYEILRKITIDSSNADCQGGMKKLKRIKGHDLALVSIAILKQGTTIRIAAGSCAPTPVRLRDFSITDSANRICSEAQKFLKPINDLRASKDFRIFMAKQFITDLLKHVGKSN